ncbi:hypothetical protein PO878_08080 [Iamia majanohamensis]|uniref:Uncharacterized protein n=1 Tax=Iamia majanohamensis TaxID=467976 RepID=A0AAE9Y8G9_9ACTN|nr:hypothetical protein [Iamia majanohamensis]WCO68685.1 hypothetical protein PO878_08080 [Iamia majanohamensis]
MATTWRLKAASGHGWVEHLDHDGRVAITADPEGARQWATRAQVDAALARVRRGGVGVQPVEGPAFDHRPHGGQPPRHHPTLHPTDLPAGPWTALV